jgi:hypothetical protein
MAEIDRIKALAGLLDDDDDDLFPCSSSSESEAHQSTDGAASTQSGLQSKQLGSKTSSVSSGQLRHGVVKTEQHDNIIREMNKKKLNVTKKNVQSNSAQDRPVQKFKLGQPRLTIQTSEPIDVPNNESDESGDQLVFGRPQTFGAAGGYNDDYMPNVKERAVAISAWKILEMKKERKNGHARAREWALREEGDAENRGDDQYVNVVYAENVDRNEKVEKETSGKKGKIPSFLAQFDDYDDENTENSVNGVVCQPTTPRGGGGSGARVPLSPRNPSGGMLTPRNNIASPRDIGVGPKNVVPIGVGIVVSPRNHVLSPRSKALVTPSKASGGRRSLDGKSKINSASSPRNKTMSPRNQVLSPRSNALLSPSMAAGKSLKHSKPVETATMPPKSPRFAASVKTTCAKKEITNEVEAAAPTVVEPVVKTMTTTFNVDNAAKPQAVKFKGVEVIGELASVLERRYAKSGVPESPMAKDVCGDAVDGNVKEVISGGLAVNGPSKAEKQDNSEPIVETTEEAADHVKHVKDADKSSEQVDQTVVKNKTISETLEEASRFLQASEIRDDINEDDSSNSIDSKIDEELSAAAELAHALDMLLLGSDSSSQGVSDEVTIERDDVCVETYGTMTPGGNAMTCLSPLDDDENTEREKSHSKVNKQVTFRDQWNLSETVNDPRDMFAFPTDFEGLSSSQFAAAEFPISNGEDIFFATFSGEETSQISENTHMKSAGGSRKKSKGAELKKPTKIQVNLKINGAKSLNIGKDNDESLFFVSQPSPSCGDHADLLGAQNSFSSPKALEAPKFAIRDAPKKRGVALNSPTKKRLNNLGLKLGLINNAVPSKTDRGNDVDSPSMAGLLNSNTVSTGIENVGMVSNSELKELTPSHQRPGHFFDAPSSPIIFGTAAMGSPLTKASPADFSGGKKTKASKILQRITSPLLNRRTVRAAELNDDASI